jgi:hypothetical protein
VKLGGIASGLAPSAHHHHLALALDLGRRPAQRESLRALLTRQCPPTA